MSEEKKSVFQVIIHSFFVVPFIIAIFGVLIFLMVRVLTLEPSTAHDYLEDVKLEDLRNVGKEHLNYQKF